MIEYKRPDDSLNERTLRKAVGYANFLIASAEHEGDVDSSQVTVTIFRSSRNPELFKKMLAEGTLKETKTPGIYHVIGYTDMAFQVVVTNELQGDEYAAYRALTNRPSEDDIEKMWLLASRETDELKRAHYEVYFRLQIEKNYELVEGLKRRHEEMEEKLFILCKDVFDMGFCPN